MVRALRGVAAAAFLLSLTACASRGTTPPAASPSPAAGTTSAPAASAATSGTRVTVTSTLDGRTSLPKRLLWEVTPTVTDGGSVDRIEFYIDGKLGWVEHSAPYDYSDDGGNLVTTFLPAGRHEFRAVATLADGTSAADEVTATVSDPPPPPATWRGVTWARTISGGDPSADGIWTIAAEPFGWHIADPQGGGANQDLDWAGPDRVRLYAYINEPVLGDYQYGGAFCEAPDPTHDYRYRISADGRTLTLAPASTDPCGGRAFILTGTWKRR